MSDDILKDFFEVKDQVLKQEKIEEQKLSVLEEILEFSKLKNIKEEKNLKENESELVDSLVGMAESIKVSQLTDLKEDIDIENGQSVLSELSDFLTDTKKEIFVRENPILAKATDHLSGQLINDHLKPADDYEINRDNIISNLTTQAKHITEQVTTGDISLEGLKKEFTRFKQLTNLQLQSLGGGGSTKISAMDDVDTSAQQDGYALKYNASTNSYDFGEVASDLSALDQSILPDAANTRDIGSTSKTWRNGYFENIYVSGSTLEVSNDAVLKGDIQLGVNTGDSTEDTITVNGRFVSNLEPLTTIAYDLGSPERRWRDIYLSGNTIDLAGATISGDGTGQILISASGATLPTGSKIGTKTIAPSDAVTGIVTKSVPLFTVTSGLSTAAVEFTMSAGGGLGGSVFKNFTKANGDIQGRFELFTF